MKYKIPNETAGYLPEVFSLLKSLDEEHVYSYEHKLSHPADIFILTFRDAVECINGLAKSVNELTDKASHWNKINNEDLFKINKKIFELLFYTGNFVEGCQSIIKCIFPAGDKNFTKVTRDFRSNVEGYTSHASQLINKVKHQHRRPRVFTFVFDNKIIVGYYLESLVEKGFLGPDPELHKKYMGMQTGFSLNRMIPYHLCNLYYVSACLLNVIKKHGKFGASSVNTLNDDYFRQVFMEVEKVPCMLFPDEFEKSLPTVTHKGDEKYLLELPGRKPVLNNKTQMVNVSIELRMGVYDRGFALPYMAVEK